jgi:steroid delta-isomerase-like uncharacterized protein
MSVTDVAQEFVLTLRRAADGGPCGTLRRMGHDDERDFEGWIGLIGLITEYRRTIMGHATTMRSTYERISAGDLDGFAALVADDFVEHEGLPGLLPSKDGMLDYFRMLLAAFPDMRLDVDDLIDGEDKTVARVTATGTHQGEFMGVAATGNRLEMPLIDILRFDDNGLVCEHWGVADLLSLMQQIGAVPA